MGVGLSGVDSNTDLAGLPLSRDRIRYLSVDARLDVADAALGARRPGQTLLRGEIMQGLSGLGATPTGSPLFSRANAHNDFTVIRLDGLRIQTLAPRLRLVLSAEAQLSSTPLPAPMQMGVSGARFGRGFDASEIVGDAGAAGSIEARYAMADASGLFGAPELYAYYEGGAVWLHTPLAGEVRTRSLSSAGLGIRLPIANRVLVELELAKPLTRPAAGSETVRPMFTVSTRF